MPLLVPLLLLFPSSAWLWWWSLPRLWFVGLALPMPPMFSLDDELHSMSMLFMLFMFMFLPRSFRSINTVDLLYCTVLYLYALPCRYNDTITVQVVDACELHEMNPKPFFSVFHCFFSFITFPLFFILFLYLFFLFLFSFLSFFLPSFLSFFRSCLLFVGPAISRAKYSDPRVGCTIDVAGSLMSPAA